MNNKLKQLIFVYNANSSLFAQATDFVHKIVSPNTYQCNLCKITYGNLSMKREWKEYIESLNIPVSFLHKDEFYRIYPEYKSNDFPAIFIREKNSLTLLTLSKKLNSVKNMHELIELVSSNINNIASPQRHCKQSKSKS